MVSLFKKPDSLRFSIKSIGLVDVNHILSHRPWYAMQSASPSAKNDSIYLSLSSAIIAVENRQGSRIFTAKFV